MHETSGSLLDRLRDNPDAASWQRLVDLNARLIQAGLRRHGLQSTDSDDLARDVLAVLVRELPTCEHRRPRGLPLLAAHPHRLGGAPC
jgi:hypothetical protein